MRHEYQMSEGLKLSAVSSQLSAFHESAQQSCYGSELNADS